MTGDIFMSTCKLLYLLTLEKFVSTNLLTRFVDRDMYMRYSGGGIGHYKVDLMEGSRDSAPPPEPEPTAQAFDTLNNHGDANFQTVDPDDAVLTNLLDSGGDSDSDHEDSESESEGSDNYDEEGIEENFGAEDGEGMFGDVEDEEGYAPL